MFLFLVSITIVLDLVKGQGGGTTAAGDIYVCVPPGYCDYGGTPSSPGIDPRIVTPGQLCPTGQIPCYTQGPSSRCGERFVTPTPSNADGQAAFGANPWQAYIRNASHPVYAGSGVLIDNYHILTAAHKVATSVSNVNPPSSVTVIMGVTDPSTIGTNTQTRTASRIIVHPDFDIDFYKNDIAIIRVNPPFALNQTNINSLCLPSALASGATSSPYVGQTCLVAGWGETNYQMNDQPTSPMKQVNVPVVDTATCRAGLLTVVPQVDNYLETNGAEVCAGGESMKDACTFDGGAPLTCPNIGRGNIAGLVIWGKGCGMIGVQGVYVSVPYYRGWIDGTIQALNG